MWVCLGFSRAHSQETCSWCWCCGPPPCSSVRSQTSSLDSTRMSLKWRCRWVFTFSCRQDRKEMQTQPMLFVHLSHVVKRGAFPETTHWGFIVWRKKKKICQNVFFECHVVKGESDLTHHSSIILSDFSYWVTFCAGTLTSPLPGVSLLHNTTVIYIQCSEHISCFKINPIKTPVHQALFKQNTGRT